MVQAVLGYEAGAQAEVRISGARASFIGQLLRLLGDTRLLFLFDSTGTTITDKSRNARVLTWSKAVQTFDIPPVPLGYGTAVVFDGVDEEGDIPDAANLSFGDGAVDEPFSIVVLVNTDQITAIASILAKATFTTGSTAREWVFTQNGDGTWSFVVYDESANANIAVTDTAALTVGAWTLLVGTYDGTGANTGLRIYKDAVQTSDSRGSSGTYVAMENTTALVRLAFEQGASGTIRFWDGRIALVALCAKELTVDEVWNIKEWVNSWFGLSL